MAKPVSFASVVKNQKGIHGKPSQHISGLIKKYPGHTVSLHLDDGRKCNPQDEMALMTLGIRYNETVYIDIVGQKAKDLAEELRTYIEDKLYELECKNFIRHYVSNNDESPEIIAKLLIISKPEDLKTWYLASADNQNIVFEMQNILRDHDGYCEEEIVRFGNVINEYLHS